MTGIAIALGYEKMDYLGTQNEVQLFVHKDGWVVAYLTKYQLAAEMFDWVNYNANRLTSTLIENQVRDIALRLGEKDFNVTYYDFRHPDATSLFLVAKRIVLGVLAQFDENRLALPDFGDSEAYPRVRIARLRIKLSFDRLQPGEVVDDGEAFYRAFIEPQK